MICATTPTRNNQPIILLGPLRPRLRESTYGVTILAEPWQMAVEKELVVQRCHLLGNRKSARHDRRHSLSNVARVRARVSCMVRRPRASEVVQGTRLKCMAVNTVQVGSRWPRSANFDASIKASVRAELTSILDDPELPIQSRPHFFQCPIALLRAWTRYGCADE